ncbi:MAG: large conductance mechanosensitive channel protein MscL [Clostridia bacterium]|nr:large conductance mechanosensitive channel protein MscL [Clostridia bacterium]
MFKEFKEFISKGNVMDMAIGVIIANAFAAIVTAFTESFIQPLLGLIGGAEIHGTIPLGSSGQAIDYGTFLTAVVNFLIVAFILFMMIKIISTAEKKSKERLEKLAKLAEENAGKITDKVPLKKGKKNKKEEEVPAEPTTKLCPHCLSEIPFKATRCPHCTSKLEGFKEEVSK